ncbi:MAG TPA: flagellar export protein FliJ [Dissulfurispiraceae bacterium]|nr:flagellar export protein FliJ [Dissulfurispiraceae bacterium]
MSDSVRSLLNLKRWSEDEAKNFLALLMKDLSGEEERLALLEQQHAAVSVKLDGSTNGVCTIEEIRRLQDYMEHVIDRIGSQQKVVKKKQMEVDDARSRLMGASRERKTFERLDEIHRKADGQKKQRKEQSDADERSVSHFGRRDGR